MGADNDIHRAIGQTFDGCADFFGRAEAAHFCHFDRPFGEPVHQRLVMLLRQQGGRRKNGNLFATGDGDEGGTQGDFGFTKTYITAHQPVHGARADHVLDHAMDGGTLVRGFFKAKVVGKGFVILRRVAESVAFTGSAAGVDVE